jgi:glutamyl-tRNA synthetase
MTHTTVRTRIAPSPTGYPHIGTLFQALFDYVFAKKHSGQFIVRIEDTDRSRYVADAEAAIYHAFDWAGLTPDESPEHGGQAGPYRQSERLDIYQDHARQLIDKGHAYYCFCSQERLEQVRRDRQQAGLPPMYDRHCRDLLPATAAARAASEPHVIRMKVPDNERIITNDLVRGEIAFESAVVDDQVILKSDGFPTYHLAVVVDDHLMGITHVIRGEEWISSSPKHILLYRYFDWPVPALIHTPLLRNPDKSKLSKRHGHSAVSWYIDQGYLPEAVVNFLASRVWNHPEGREIFTLKDLITHFEFEAMHILGPIVDLKKLDWLNGQWIRSLSEADLLKRLEPFRPAGLEPELLAKILPHIKERLVRLAELPELTGYFYKEPQIDPEKLQRQARLTPEDLAKYLSAVYEALEQLDDWSVPAIEASLRALQAVSGLKPRPAFMSIRYALTGAEATPPLFDVIHLLGQKTVLARLKNSM